MLYASSSPSRWPGVVAGATAIAGASPQGRPTPVLRRPLRFLCAGGPAGVAAPGDGRRRWTNPDGDRRRGREQWVRQPELSRRWVESENATPDLSKNGGRGGGRRDGGGEDSFTIVSHNILGVDNASKHVDLYPNIPFDVMKWGRRKELICRDVHNWNADIVCLQEVDRYNDLLSNLKREGYIGTFKQRTGDAVDGCAIFWRENVFHLLEEKSIEFKGFGLHDNVAQLCIFEADDAWS